MRVFLWSLLGFVLGLMAGYCAILFGWIGYSELFQVFDADGGRILSIALLVAPLGGLATGLLMAFWLALRAAQRQVLMEG